MLEFAYFWLPDLTANSMRTLALLLILLHGGRLPGQSYENIQYHIELRGKVAGRHIANGDTLIVLAKSAGSKYVDSTGLHRLDKKNGDYYFILPDSLPDGSYCAYYNDKKKNLAFVVSYKDHKRNGPYNYFYYDQTLKATGFYHNNCFDKVCISFLRTGRLSWLQYFEDCKAEGAGYDFYLSGGFFRYTEYKNGAKDGRMLQYTYDKKGFPAVRYQLTYKNGAQAQ